MNTKKKNMKTVITFLTIIIGLITVGSIVWLFNNKITHLNIKSDTEKYTLTSGNTGDIAEITAEEFNAIAEKLSEIEFIENEEKFSGWSYSVSYSDEGKNHKLVIVNANKVTLDGKTYDVKDGSDNTLYSYMVSLGNKYFK